jgi:hypothetical protein
MGEGDLGEVPQWELMFSDLHVEMKNPHVSFLH